MSKGIEAEGTKIAQAAGVSEGASINAHESVVRKLKEKFGEDPAYEEVKKYLFPRLLGSGFKDKFSALSDGVVEIGKLDFMIRIYVLVEEDEKTTAFPVTIRLMDRWGLTEETLLHDAFTNAQEKSPAEIIPLGDMLGLYAGENDEGAEAIDGADPEEMGRGSDLVYVLTNKSRLFGAVTMFYDNVLHDFEERIGEKFSVIPSSVHEVLLVPDSMGISVKELRQVLLDVNRDVVDPQEVLGTHIYRYDPECGLQLPDTETK